MIRVKSYLVCQQPKGAVAIGSLADTLSMVGYMFHNILSKVSNVLTELLVYFTAHVR